jgi:phage shock protein C
MEPKRYLRSKTDRVFAGVCGGLAEYFSIDPLLIRLLFVVLALAGGGGVLIYIILWIVAPEKPESYNNSQAPPTMEKQQPPAPEPEQTYKNPQPSPPSPPETKYRKPHRGLIGGLVLITLGVLFLIAEFVPGIDFGDLWPILLVVIGIGLLIRSISGRGEKN